VASGAQLPQLRQLIGIDQLEISGTDRSSATAQKIAPANDAEGFVHGFLIARGSKRLLRTLKRRHLDLNGGAMNLYI